MLRTIFLPIHITAGFLGIITGFVALYSAKGATLHRRAGIAFVYAMLTMATSATLLATLVKPNTVNLLSGLFTFYLVTTALLAVRPRSSASRQIDAAGLLVILGIAAAYLMCGFVAARSPAGRMFGYPPPVFFGFGAFASLAAAGDVRFIVSNGLRGSRRIARHLWRMCFGMFIATGSFFLGQAKVFPKSIRIVPLLAAPVLLVLATTLYWMWRVRIRSSLRGLVTKTEAPATRFSNG